MKERGLSRLGVERSFKGETSWRKESVDEFFKYTRTYSNRMTLATIKGSGHIATQYNPEECFIMFTKWIANVPFQWILTLSARIFGALALSTRLVDLRPAFCKTLECSFWSTKEITKISSQIGTKVEVLPGFEGPLPFELQINRVMVKKKMIAPMMPTIDFIGNALIRCDISKREPCQTSFLKIKQTELKANNPESLSMTQMLNASERRPNTGESSRTEMQKNAENLQQSGAICPRVQPPRVYIKSKTQQ
ncbi:hypothetical protein Fmac_029040 [Flemingia macrophylla]|uniref:Uncharacterized protein n=1 Tax=Flemingia macrophylla TaxID=520843 RepID=A0ABD1L9A2_9FABA